MYTFDEGHHSCTIQDVQITNAPDYGLSSHSMCLFNDTDIIIVGGYISKSVSDEYPEMSKSVHLLSLYRQQVFDIQQGICDFWWLYCWCYRIPCRPSDNHPWGYWKTIIHADSCALDKDCNIDSRTTSPIAWVQCDGCNLWYHLFCLGKTAIVSGQDWFCESCMNALRKKRQQNK